MNLSILCGIGIASWNICLVAQTQDFNRPLNDWNVSNDVTSMAVRRNEPRVIELPDDDVEFDSDFRCEKEPAPSTPP